MKMKNLRLAPVACVLAVCVLPLGACTEGPSFSEAAAAQTAVSPGRSRIAIYRSQQVQGFGVKPDVLVDGLPTGKCQVNSMFYVDIPPGQHIVSASTTETSVARLTVSRGQTAYVRCSIEVGPIVGVPKLVETPRPVTDELVFTGQY